MSSHRQGVSHKGTKTWNFWNQRDGQKKFFFSKTTKNPTKQTVFCHMWELQSSSIYKINGTTLWHMLQLIPRTAASKKKKSFKPNVTAGSSQNRGSPLVCLALLPLPQSENLTPNSTIEYANYLHIKNTPRKTKSMAQMLYKDTGQGSEGPDPFFFFRPTWCSSAEGSKGQACGGDDAEMVYPIPCKSSPLDRGEELGRGCFRQLKSKGPGLGRAGTLSERAGGQRAFYWLEGLGSEIFHLT